MSKKARILEEIIEAAHKRFAHYGYGKTTMSEIAGDCKMSPGNLYRYFPGKLDIAECIAEKTTDLRLERIRTIVRDSKLSATERLRLFLLDALRDTYETLDADQRIVEVAQFLARERPEFANRQLAKERALMAEILSAGNASGEFDIQDVLSCAETIQAATLKFKLPQLHSSLPLDQLERELEGVFELIVQGLKAEGEKRLAAPSPA